MSWLTDNLLSYELIYFIICLWVENNFRLLWINWFYFPSSYIAVSPYYPFLLWIFRLDSFCKNIDFLWVDLLWIKLNNIKALLCVFWLALSYLLDLLVVFFYIDNRLLQFPLENFEDNDLVRMSHHILVSILNLRSLKIQIK